MKRLLWLQSLRNKLLKKTCLAENAAETQALLDRVRNLIDRMIEHKLRSKT